MAEASVRASFIDLISSHSLFSVSKLKWETMFTINFSKFICNEQSYRSHDFNALDSASPPNT